VKVPTTNGVRDTFRVGDNYYGCEGGEIYVAADSIEGAAKQIPIALSIEVVGAFAAPSPQAADFPKSPVND